MRVAYGTLNEFLADIEVQIKEMDGTDCVFQKAIRVSKTESDYGKSSNGSIKAITFQCSAVLMTEDNGEYIAEFGQECGKDYHTADQEFEGSEKADELRKQVEEFCVRTGLKLRHGVIDM